MQIKSALESLWKKWLALGEFLGDIVSFFVLNLIYLLVFTPMGILYNLYNKLTKQNGKNNWQSKEKGGNDYEPY